jgi:hypothetical protein
MFEVTSAIQCYIEEPDFHNMYKFGSKQVIPVLRIDTVPTVLIIWSRVKF